MPLAFHDELGERRFCRGRRLVSPILFGVLMGAQRVRKGTGGFISCVLLLSEFFAAVRMQRNGLSVV